MSHPYSRPVKLDASADGAVVIRESGPITDGFLPLFSTSTVEEAEGLRVRFCRKHYDGVYRLTDFGGSLEDLQAFTEKMAESYGATRVWNRALYTVNRETHVYYINGVYAGSVYRDKDSWSACKAGEGNELIPVDGLDEGKTFVEEQNR